MKKRLGEVTMESPVRAMWRLGPQKRCVESGRLCKFEVIYKYCRVGGGVGGITIDRATPNEPLWPSGKALDW